MLLDHRGNLLPTNVKSLNLDQSYFSLGGAGELTTKDIEEKPYQNHAWTYACASTIARNVSSQPLQIVNKITKEVLEDRWGIIELFTRPNPYMTATSFFTFVVLGLLIPDNENEIAGQVFITPQKNNDKVNLQLRKEMPDVLLPFGNKYFEPNVPKNETGLQKLQGWNFSVNGGQKTPYDTNELIRVYLPNPYSWLDGLAPFTPAKAAFISDVKSDLYNSALFDNNATPAGILTSDAVLTEPQKKSAMQSWMAEYGGAANASKIAVMGKGIKFDRIAMTQQDMQFAESKENALERIIAAYGLNKIALGMYEDINLATIREGRKILWQDTYLPMGRNIMESINSQWIYYIDPTIELRFNTSGVEALRPDYAVRTKSAATMVKDMAVPASVACRINEIPLTEEDLINFPHLDAMPILPATEAAIITAGLAAEQAGADVDKDDKKSKALQEKTTKEEQDKIRASYVLAVLDPGEKKLQKIMDRFFISQRNRMQDNVDKWLAINKSFTKAIAENTDANIFILDLPTENAKLTQLFKPVVADQLDTSTLALKEELGELMNWEVTDPLIDVYVANRKEEIASINSTTMNKAGKEINEAIGEALKNNESTAQAAKRIKEIIGDTMDGRRVFSKTIARTEIGIITNKSRHDAFRKEGIEYWEWLTAQDGQERTTHLHNNGAVRLVGMPFKNGLEYPLQVGKPPEEVINCRCMVIASEGPTVG